jgi:hypothetical protein
MFSTDALKGSFYAHGFREQEMNEAANPGHRVIKGDPYTGSQICLQDHRFLSINIIASGSYMVSIVIRHQAVSMFSIYL